MAEKSEIAVIIVYMYIFWCRYFGKFCWKNNEWDYVNLTSDHSAEN